MGAGLRERMALLIPGFDSTALNNRTAAAPTRLVVDSPLTAPALILAFAPIVLSTVIQPSGRMFGLPSSCSISLRISPLICAVSAILTVVQLVYGAFTSGSIEEALLKVAAQRFQHGNEDSEEEVQFSQWSTLLRLGIFTFGALPQAVKLYASDGVPWTQACCTAFLAAFVLEEALLYLFSRLSFVHLLRDRQVDRKGDDDNLWLSSKTSRKLPRLVRWIGLPHLLIYALTLKFDVMTLSKLHGQTWKTALALFPPICCVTLLLYIKDKEIAWLVTEMFLYANPFGIAVVLGPWATPLTGPLWALLAMAIGIPFTVAVYLLNGVVSTRLPAGSAKMPLRPATFVVLNHVIYTLFYLGVAYDSTGTSRPYWTSWIG